MKYPVFITAVWFAMVACCHGQCGVANLPEPTPSQSNVPQPTGCVYQGMVMDFESTVIKDCTSYTCSKNGVVTFCGVGVRVVSHPPDCKVVPGDNGCGTKAVKIDDESIECTDGVAAISRRSPFFKLNKPI